MARNYRVICSKSDYDRAFNDSSLAIKVLADWIRVDCTRIKNYSISVIPDSDYYIIWIQTDCDKTKSRKHRREEI